MIRAQEVHFLAQTGSCDLTRKTPSNCRHSRLEREKAWGHGAPALACPGVVPVPELDHHVRSRDARPRRTAARRRARSRHTRSAMSRDPVEQATRRRRADARARGRSSRGSRGGVRIARRARRARARCPALDEAPRRRCAASCARTPRSRSGTIGHPDGFEPLADGAARGPGRSAVSGRDLARRDRSGARVRAARRGARRSRSAGRLGGGACRSARSAITRRDRSPDVAARSQDASTRFDIAYALAELGDRLGHDGARRPALATPNARGTRSAALAALKRCRRRSRRALTIEEGAAGSAGARRRQRCWGSQPRAMRRARRVLVDALGARKVHVRGLAIEQLGEVGGAMGQAARSRSSRAPARAASYSRRSRSRCARSRSGSAEGDRSP